MTLRLIDVVLRQHPLHTLPLESLVYLQERRLIRDFHSRLVERTVQALIYELHYYERIKTCRKIASLDGGLTWALEILAKYSLSEPLSTAEIDSPYLLDREALLVIKGRSFPRRAKAEAVAFIDDLNNNKLTWLSKEEEEEMWCEDLARLDELNSRYKVFVETRDILAI